MHPVSADVEGSIQAMVMEKCNCSHGAVIHGSGGGCRGAGCMCGWMRNEMGALVEKRTLISASSLGKLGRRVEALLKIPCYFCGEPSETIDHFIPRSRGGGAGSNKVSACRCCNQMKADMFYEELLERCRKVLEWHAARKKAHQT